MKKLILISLGILFSILSEGQSFALDFRSLDYNSVREEGGFNATTLTNVMYLYPGGKNLSESEIEDLANSKTLINVHTLDLRNQPAVNDAIIAKITENPTFARILTLKLSGTNITNDAIDRIAKSRILGSVRDLPSISGRYGCPSSVVKVYTKDTRVTQTTLEPTFEFHIEYKPPSPRGYPWEPIDHGVKIVEIDAY